MIRQIISAAVAVTIGAGATWGVLTTRVEATCPIVQTAPVVGPPSHFFDHAPLPTTGYPEY